MRRGFALTLIITLLFTGGYFYYISEAVCSTSLEYRIGALDERFTLTHDEAKLVVAEAASVWEDGTGRNLFSYNEGADFAINFVFDERQAFADAEEDFKDRLDQAEWANESIAQQYESLVEDYDTQKAAYEAEAASYESALERYNDEVQGYNQSGGAPPKVFERLERDKEVIDQQQTNLNHLASNLNQLVEDINDLSTQGKRVIETYNRGVDVYNETFGDVREFTQGDYQGENINIYTFKDDQELKVVVAHELGHALHLGHVDGKESVMYFLIGDQPEDLVLSATDSAEFARMCGKGLNSTWERLRWRLQL